MRIMPVSDLHLEFHSDGGEEFLSRLTEKSDEIDILVVAGDFATKRDYCEGVNFLAGNFANVILVLGNHECYGSSIAQATELTTSCADQHENVHFLNRGVVEIKGQKFIGGCLWFPYDPFNALYQGAMNDFRAIANFEREVYEENKKGAAFLRREVMPEDIVVTHYLPSYRSVHPSFKGSELNRFFVCPMDDLIEGVQPKAWIHGHTHFSLDYEIGATRVLCNPYGYEGRQLNDEFNQDLVLDA